MPVTEDRADIMHFAGWHRLSPALRDGVPALVAASDTAGRCGWAEFFAALGARRLALDLDPGGGTFRFVPRAELRRRPRGRGPAGPSR
jgi:hypothetical protein